MESGDPQKFLRDLKKQEVVRAPNDPKFYVRFKWVGVAMLVFMVWSLYDGIVKYPMQLERYEAWKGLHAQLEEEGLNREEDGDYYEKRFSEEWQSISTEANWRVPIDKTIKERHVSAIYSNYAFAVIGGVVGSWMLLTVWLSQGRWIEVSKEGLDSSSGDSVAFSDATLLDKKQWDSKGIAWLHFEKEGGSKGRFLIDNYKYMRDETNEILIRVEQAIGADKIRGGLPETTDDSDPSSDQSSEE